MSGDVVYDSRSIASYLISKAKPAGGLDALQVMKLVYISHGFMLGLNDRPLIEDDIEAWKFGPAIRRVYACLPGGSSSITEPFRSVPTLSQKAQEIVDSVHGQYGHISGWYLSTLTHRHGSPWEKTWSAYGQNAVIPQALIREHYKNIIEKYRAAEAAGEKYVIEAL